MRARIWYTESMTERESRPMRKIGARVHDGLTIERTSFAADLRGLGLESAQLTLPKFYPGYAFGDDAESFRVVRRIREEFDAAGVSVAVLSGYVNPVHPTDADGEAERFRRFVRYAAAMGVGTVGTETGTVTDRFEREYAANRTDEVFRRLIDNMRRMNDYAAARGVRLGVEAVTWFPVHSVETMARLLDALDDNAAVIFDPVNVLSAVNWRSQREIMRAFVQTFGRRFAAVHVKNFKPEGNAMRHVGLFEERGRFDLPYLLELLETNGVGCDLILEDTPPGQMAHTAARLKEAVRLYARPSDVPAAAAPA